MSNFVSEKSLSQQRVLLHFLNIKKTSTESHRILVIVYGEHEFGLKNKKRPE